MVFHHFGKSFKSNPETVIWKQSFECVEHCLPGRCVSWFFFSFFILNKEKPIKGEQRRQIWEYEGLYHLSGAKGSGNRVSKVSFEKTSKKLKSTIWELEFIDTLFLKCLSFGNFPHLELGTFFSSKTITYYFRNIVDTNKIDAGWWSLQGWEEKGWHPSISLLTWQRTEHAQGNQHPLP